MTFALKMYKINKECEVIDNHAKYSFDQAWFLFGWAGSKQWILLGSDVFHELDKSFLALIYHGIAGGTRAKPRHTSYSRPWY